MSVLFKKILTYQENIRILLIMYNKPIIHIALSGCFVVVPLAFVPWHFHAFEAGKWFAFIACMLLAAGCFAFSSCFHLSLPIPRSRLSLAVAVYGGYFVISFLYFPFTDTKYFLQTLCAIALFFLVSLTINLRERDYLLLTLIAAASVAALIGALQFFGITFIQGFHLYFGDVSFGLFKGMRVFGTLGHPNLLGGYCASLLPILAMFIFSSWKDLRKLQLSAYLIAMLLLSSALLFSRTRASWLATLCSFSVLALTYSKYRKRLLIGLCTLAFFGTLLVRIIPDLSDATSLRFRSTYYHDTISIIKDYPLFGRGPGTFNVYYPRYRDHRLAAKIGEQTRDFRVEHPHNEHLEQLSDGGLFGYGLFLWLLIEAFIRLLRRRALIDTAIAASLFGLLVEACFSQNLRFIAISSVFWLFLGMANLSVPQKEITLPEKFPHRNLLRTIGSLLVLLLCLYALRFSYRLTHADTLLKTGMDHYFSQRLPEAIAAFRAVIADDKKNKQAWYYLASASNAMHEPEQAITAYQQLLLLDPNFLRANFLLADLYLQQNQPEKALMHLRHQIAANSMDWEAYGLAAFIELQSNHVEAARSYLQEIQAIHAIIPVKADVLQQVEALLQQMPIPSAN